ncbi:hypothetical protein [Candidatus Chloroploca sp. Khr17]|uniref:hypothetical protein n=1 Tax=Candidatus Chloroploca sp. Khr17 TaxID=2496869 RepID=UPI001F0F2791|nr:hypothetical protein [Candidatus Chloroploca sp. Khr17]
MWGEPSVRYAQPRVVPWPVPGLFLVFVLLLLSGCVTVADQEVAGAGASSPQAVVESFIEDLNTALAEENLTDPEVRRIWAERLASHFAPSERVDQRNAMSQMLLNFVTTANEPVVGSRATLKITYSYVEILRREEGRALVNLVDGTFVLVFLDAEDNVLRERTGGLTEVLGQTSGGLPVIQVGSSWYMTEG